MMSADRLTTDQRGAIAELAIARRAIEMGVEVYRPVVEGGRYDLIFGLGRTLLRVQCKWTRRKRDVIPVPFYSSRRTADGLRRRVYSAVEIDAVAAYCPDVERCFLLPTASSMVGLSSICDSARVETVSAWVSIGLTISVSRGYNQLVWGRSSAGRASGWHPEGQGFDPPRLHPKPARRGGFGPAGSRTTVRSPCRRARCGDRSMPRSRGSATTTYRREDVGSSVLPVARDAQRSVRVVQARASAASTAWSGRQWRSCEW